MAMSIQLPEDAERRLRATAHASNVSAEQLAVAVVREFLAHPDAEFEAAATLVLRNNVELYRRLA
ncbi:MAG: hypothetical protein NW201_11325 [Gemmatimonadales bacterium]|nr:hypothetical protein [Gemmatimonadales bacterium]